MLKRNLVILLIIVMLTGAGITHALTRTITGSSDEIETFIRNSNGNYWTASYNNVKEAIWDLNGTGGNIYVPDGNYLVPDDETMYIKDNINFYCNSWNTIFYRDTPTNTHMIKIDHDSSVFNGKFVGCGKDTGNDEVGIRSNGVQNNITIYHCYFTEFPNDCIIITGNKSIVKNNYFCSNDEGCEIKVTTSGTLSDIQIVDNFFYEHNKEGIEIYIDGNCYGEDIKILNNFFTECLYGVMFYGSGVFRNIIISDNSFERVTQGIIDSSSTDSGAKISNILITNNVFTNNTMAVYLQHNGWDRCEISHNIIRNGKNYGISAHTKPLTNSSISYNIITNVSGASGDGIYLKDGCHNNTISFNYITDCVDTVSAYTHGNGIYLYGVTCVDNRIFGNHITDCDDDYDIAVGNSVFYNFGHDYNSLFPFYAQTTTPTLLDNTTAFWYDTDDDYFYSVANLYGDYFYVNWTTEI